jgi:hypothetical protein
MLFYLLTIAAELSHRLTYILFAVSPFVVIWVVVSILKDKQQPEKTFDEFLYQDKDIKWSK